MRAIVTRLMADKTDADGRPLREKVLVNDWPEPEGPSGNEIKTQTICTGVTNGTERNDLIRGNYAHPDEALPAGWGYQNVGRVVEVGPDVKKLKVGDVLFMSADHMEYVVMPEAGLLLKLPDIIDPELAALFGMAGVAMHSVRNAELRMGDRLLIVGAGFIGQMAAQFAAVSGAHVTICDIDQTRLDRAGRIGAAEETINVSGDGWEKNIEDWSYDAVLDVAGVVGMEDKLVAAARSRGTVLFIAGRFRVDYNFNLAQMHEIVIRQNSHFNNSDLENVWRLVDCDMVIIAPLIQDVVPAEDAEQIYTLLRDDPQKLKGTVFVW